MNQRGAAAWLMRAVSGLRLLALGLAALALALQATGVLLLAILLLGAAGMALVGRKAR